MIDGKPKHVMSYSEGFLFIKSRHAHRLKYSRTENRPLDVARALAKPSNVLVLDEPTNVLDLEMLDVLEEMLGDYQGTVLLTATIVIFSTAW